MENEQRIERLIEYVQKLKESGSKELYAQYEEEIQGVQPQEVFSIFYRLYSQEQDPEEIFQVLDKVLNVFYHSLASYRWSAPRNDAFLQDLLAENRALEAKIDLIRPILTETDLVAKKQKLMPKIKELEQFNAHYLKKENILFPYLEQKAAKFAGLQIMWALHDLVRSQIKEVLSLLQAEETSNKELNVAIGKLFFAILGLVKKEELILFPVASELLSEEDWQAMYEQSFDYDFPFINKDKSAKVNPLQDAETPKAQLELQGGQKSFFMTETGELTLEQLLLIFNALPVDLTFVDENEQVRYFTKPKDRLFPRSPAIIGRDVKNCHPPASVHVVEEIVENFRLGHKDTASFWINHHGRFILIQYFALRDDQGNYKGTLEVSQDITEIKTLEGEKRLLDWQ